MSNKSTLGRSKLTPLVGEIEAIRREVDEALRGGAGSHGSPA